MLLRIIQALVNFADFAVIVEVGLSRFFLVLLSQVKAPALAVVRTDDFDRSRFSFVPLLAAVGSSPLLTANPILLVDILY